MSAGWKLLTRLKDHSEMLVPLCHLKKSNPLQVTLFKKSHCLDDKPAFKWLVQYTLKRADRIISLIKARVKVTTHKYGVEKYTRITNAKHLDEKNGNKIWMDTLTKEMINVSIVFDILPF